MPKVQNRGNGRRDKPKSVNLRHREGNNEVGDTDGCEQSGEAIREENPYVTASEVFLAETVLWGDGNLATNGWDTHRSGIWETCTHVGGLLRYAWLSKYVDYLATFYTRAELLKLRRNRRVSPLGNNECRIPDSRITSSIWGRYESQPARVRLISRVTELPLGMEIIRRLNITTNFRKSLSQIGQGVGRDDLQ